MTHHPAFLLAVVFTAACSGEILSSEEDDGAFETEFAASSRESLDRRGKRRPDAGTVAPAPDAGTVAPAPDAAPPAPAPDAGSPGTFVTAVTVQLEPQSGVSGVQRVNFAVPLPPGRLADETRIRVAAGAGELPAARRALARHPDGSLRSVQLQLDVDVSTTRQLQIEVGGGVGRVGPALTAVSSTLVAADGTAGPRVWVLVPATWLASSELVGPMVPFAALTGTPLDAWAEHCDYERWNTDAFQALAADKGSWLFDRVTAMYRGYGATGAIAPLRSGYREAAVYRAGLVISGGIATSIPVPASNDDVKYMYSQGLAIHYLLTGDERFREAAEAVAARVAQLWTSPGYAGGADFWTERHAGFALLAYEWAAVVSDDRAATFANLASSAVDAYLSLQDTYPVGYADTSARCFAHSADAHGEPYGYFGCSPWMSAILADGLDAHARRVGGARATTVRQALVELGRIIARDGRDSTGKPFYWMGVGTTADEVDEYNEHWGESAYLVALAWHHGGRTDAALRQAADQLVNGFATQGGVGQLRSFNWQCRSAVMTPAFLR